MAGVVAERCEVVECGWVGMRHDRNPGVSFASSVQLRPPISNGNNLRPLASKQGGGGKAKETRLTVIFAARLTQNSLLQLVEFSPLDRHRRSSVARVCRAGSVLPTAVCSARKTDQAGTTEVSSLRRRIETVARDVFQLPTAGGVLSVIFRQRMQGGRPAS